MNYIIVGDKNNFRFNFFETPPMEHFTSTSGVNSIGQIQNHMKDKRLCQIFLDLKLPIIRITLGKEQIKQLIDFNDPWLEKNFGGFMLRRMSLLDTYFEIIIEKSYTEYQINGKKFIPTGFPYIASHTVFDFKFVKTYFEFDGGFTNCIEYDGPS